MSRWNEHDAVRRGDDYDEKWRAMAAAGLSVHGEADAICRLIDETQPQQPATVLDAGCGTGRVAIELAARGHDVVGVDLDPVMLDTARTNAPELDWRLADLVEVDLGRRFDVVALPGNVMIFLAAGTEGAVIANLARHLEPDGSLIAGFELGTGHLSLADHDRHCAAVGLDLVDRWATWEGDPFEATDARYAVSVHRRATVTG